MSDKKQASVFARVLDSATYKRISPAIDEIWSHTNDNYQRYGWRYGAKPIQAGKGLVSWPFQAPFDTSWGVVSPTDQPKWRWAYRARTEARRGIDIRATYALGRGCTFFIKDKPEWQAYANNLYAALNMRNKGILMCNNALVYGQTYAEKVRDMPSNFMDTEKVLARPATVSANVDVDGAFEQLMTGYDVSKFWARGQRYSSFLLQSLNKVGNQYNEMTKEWGKISADANKEYGFMQEKSPATKTFSIKQRFQSASDKAIKSRISVNTTAITRPNFMFTGNASANGGIEAKVGKPKRSANPNTGNKEKGELVALKVLDPLYMWVQRHPMDIIVGFNQWGIGGIPQTFMPEEIMYIRYMPNSWVYESAYGASTLMSATPHISRLVQAEEDLTIWHHINAKPPTVLYAGTQERPYGPSKIGNYQNLMGSLAPNAGVVLPGDTKLEYPPTNFDPGATSVFWISYCRERIYEAIGVPSVLMNMSNSASSSSGNRAQSDVSLQGFIQDSIALQQLWGEQQLEQLIIPELLWHFEGDISDNEPLPEIECIWPTILIETRNQTMDRLAKAVGGPWYTPNEGREESGRDPIGPEEDNYKPEYDEISDMAQAGAFNQPSKGPEQSESGRSGDRKESLKKRQKGNESAD